MNSQLKGFREFLLKQNAIALAIGVIIGAPWAGASPAWSMTC